MLEYIDKRIKLEDGYEIREYSSIYGPIRGLIHNDGIQSLVFTKKVNRNNLYSAHMIFYDLPVDIYNKGKDYLVLGAGALSYPRYYICNYKDKNMDVIEINKKVIDINKEYFYLDELIEEFDPNEERFHIIIDDALNYIGNCNKKYDYILIDLFDGENPFTDIYKEKNFNNIIRILSDKGIVVINYIINKGQKDNLKLLKKAISKFEHYKIVSNKNYFDYDTITGNIIVLLANRPLEIPKIGEKYKYKELSINDLE